MTARILLDAHKNQCEDAEAIAPLRQPLSNQSMIVRSTLLVIVAWQSEHNFSDLFKVADE